MTTATLPRRTASVPRAVVILAVLVLLAGVLALIAHQLTTGSARSTTAATPAVTQQQPANAGQYNGTLGQQVPQEALTWLASQASSYAVGGSTYDQQLPYAARHAATSGWNNQDSTYREQVPASQ